MLKLGVVLLVLGMLTASCECDRRVKGVVLDRHSGEPVSGVKVNIYLHEISEDSLPEPVFTGTQGTYDFHTCKCSDVLFDFQKSGYVGFVTSLEGRDTVLLEPAALSTY